MQEVTKPAIGGREADFLWVLKRVDLTKDIHRLRPQCRPAQTQLRPLSPDEFGEDCFDLFELSRTNSLRSSVGAGQCLEAVVVLDPAPEGPLVDSLLPSELPHRTLRAGAESAVKPLNGRRLLTDRSR